MNMNPTDEQKLLQETVSKFCKAEFESEKLREMTEKEPTGLPRDLWKRIAEQGWIGVLAPEDAGGLGLSAVELALICEEMGRRLVPGPFLSTAALAVPAVSLGGNAKAREVWLEKLISGEAIGTLALLEADPVLAPSGVRATAKRDGDGWILNGKKFFVSDAEAADMFVVAARTGAGDDGTSLFAVKRAAAGVSVEPNKLTDLTSRSGQVVLKDVRVSGAALLGEEGAGWKLVAEILKIANVCISGDAVAGAERLFRTTLDYVKERRQFGVPVGSFQAVKHPMAALYAELELARSTYQYAAWAVAVGAEDASRAAALARLVCTAAYTRACQDCLQAHGGIGFTWEYDLHFFLKRAKHFQYFLGEPADYEEIVAREALGV